MVEDEDKPEALSEMELHPVNFTLEIEQYKLEYPHEKHFSVLMLSYVGPQHARYFHACMDGRKLLIRQSELFDFGGDGLCSVSYFQ
jgi:hypothetical protein